MSQKAARLMAFFAVPKPDQALFEQQFYETYVPLAKKLPGLKRLEITRQPESLLGQQNPYFLIATLLFDSMDSLKRALASPPGQEAGNNVLSFASNYMTLLAGEVETTEGVIF